MSHQPTLPVSKAFLVCGKIVEDSKSKEVSLVGFPTSFEFKAYPAARPLSFFARVASAHGDYRVEVQLQTSEGDIVWREGPPKPWRMDDPLKTYDLKMLGICPVFPEAGMYYFVLAANGEEIARQQVLAQLLPQQAES
jgi:hypothetical protein